MGVLLDRKACLIVSHLLSADDGVTVEELSQAAGVSMRSAYYSLRCINSELRRNGIDELRSVRNLGILPTPSARAALTSYLGESRGTQLDYLSSAERQAIIVCAAFIRDGVTLDELAGMCSATKRTIQNDVNTLNNHLLRYHVSVEARARRGMSLVGEEIDRRYVVLYYLDAVLSLVDAGILQVGWVDESSSERTRLDVIARTMGVTYAEDLTTRLAVILHYAGDREFVPKADLFAIERSPVSSLVNIEFPELCENTRLYASLILMTQRLQDINPRIFEDGSTITELRLVAEAILNRYADLSGVRFKDCQQLSRYLVQHLFYSLSCYRYGVVDINPLRDQVELEYPEIYAMTRIVLESLQEQIPYPITSGEVAYISLLIGSNIASRRDSLIRVLVVCGSGISAAQMIGQELEGLHPLIRVIAIAPSDQWQLHADKADLVVSSVALDGCDGAVIVHPILTDADKIKIRKALARRSLPTTQADAPDFEALMLGIEPYIKDGEGFKVRAALARVLGIAGQGATPSQLGLADLLDTNRVSLIDSHDLRWEDAIRIAGRPLTQDGSILPEYLDACIQNIVDNGDYSMYPNGMYLVHAAPESGVNRLSLVIAILSEDVPFPSGSSARFLVILAPSDYRTHIRSLTEAVRLFSDESLARKLLLSPDATSAYRTIIDRQNASSK